MPDTTCSHQDCTNTPFATGLCGKHYRRKLNAHKACDINGCTREVEIRGMCKPHYRQHLRRLHAGEPLSLMDRLKSHTTITADGCWQWTGTVDQRGYPVAVVNYKAQAAHRLAYTLAAGPIPDGLQLDHRCHTAARDACLDPRACLHRRCINPEHLDVVTNHENLILGNSPVGINARKTECIRGHAFTPANTARDRRGNRVCRECRRIRNRKAA